MGGKMKQMPPPQFPKPSFGGTAPMHLQVTKHALQAEIPSGVEVYDVLEERSDHMDRRQFVIIGAARGKTFHIKLERERGAAFPYDEAIVKLMVFA
jgi:hypothetical protein